MFPNKISFLFAAFLLLDAIACYFLGCLNGAALIANRFYHDDVRRHGSGNAGLTNFCRTYGVKRALFVIAVDVGKTLAAVGCAALLFRAAFDGAAFPAAVYFGGLFCVLGHIFPVTAHFRGGKGILCSGTLLLLLDWRITLIGWGLFLLLFFATRRVSLGSLAAAVSFPVTTVFVYHTPSFSVMALLIALAALWAHRENIKRLLHGKENRFSLHGTKSEEQK